MSIYFSKKELQCHGKNCCGHSAPMDSHFMEKMDIIRKIYGKPMYPTSAFRCNKHNAAVGGVENSNHSLGRAMDVYVKDRDYERLADIAKNYLSEVIIYTEKNFIHLGDDY